MIIQKSSVPGAHRWLSHLSIPLFTSAKVMILLFLSLSPCSRTSRSLLGIIPLYLFFSASPTLILCLPLPQKKLDKERTIPSAPRIPSCWITVTPPLRPGNHLSPTLISYKWIVIVGTFMRLVSFIQHHAFSIHLFLNVSLYVYTRVCLTIHFLKDICVCPFLSVMTRVAVNICVHVFFFFL